MYSIECNRLALCSYELWMCVCIPKCFMIDCMLYAVYIFIVCEFKCFMVCVCMCVCGQGWGGISSTVFLSLPCVLGASGSTRLAGISLGQEDDLKLKASVSSQDNLMSQLRL